MSIAGFNIVNLIHIGDTVVNFEDLTEEQKCEIGLKLNRQALTAVGYQEVKDETDKTAYSGGDAEFKISF